mmetsp:Transcript_15210/g.17926  ORF Transcript_15210/g.17926 Transcript_15210/m.17926 type:complete len:275 (+) Transcript_15210:90-914(+)
MIGIAKAKEDLLRQHKAERKVLRKQCNEALNGTKGEGRAKVEEANNGLREEQKARHEKELAKLMESLELENREEDEQPRVTKAQKRREKKVALEEANEKEREALKHAAGPTAKEVETEKISQKLRVKNLVIKDISSDGHCMYRAIVHQLETKVHNDNTIASSKAPHMLLRSMCVAYMKEHRHMFEPFMVFEDGESFESYCAKMRNTSVWGGQLELRALANALHQTIVVVNGDSDDVVMGEEFMTNPDDAIILTYHKHYLSLGEHYNSTEPLKES